MRPLCTQGKIRSDEGKIFSHIPLREICFLFEVLFDVTSKATEDFPEQSDDLNSKQKSNLVYRL